MAIRGISLKKIVDKGINLFLWLCGIVVLWLLIQIFCMTSFHIPSDSMEPELLAGDVILSKIVQCDGSRCRKAGGDKTFAGNR